MNQKGFTNIAILIAILIVVGGAGYFALTKNQRPDSQNQQIVFASQKECEEKTDRPCDVQMCDYIPAGKTFEEVCGKDFKTGWVPIKSSPIPENNSADQSTTQPKTDINVSSEGRVWGCRSVTQGMAPDPNNPPPTVCGYIPTCSGGQSLVTSLGEGTWSDGSRKGTFTCSSELPPSTSQ